jgi:hypothetical protein
MPSSSQTVSHSVSSGLFRYSWISQKLSLSRKLNCYTPRSPTDKTKEFLRHFFDALPPDGKENLVQDVLKQEKDEGLWQLAESIRTGLIIPLKVNGGKTPAITPSPRPGRENSVDNLKDLQMQPINRSSQAQLRNHCLARDGNRCVATGLYSPNHKRPRNAMTTHLRAAHIIPVALESFQCDEDGKMGDKAADIWVQLRHYFPTIRDMGFTSTQINSEMNMMMLDAHLHSEFGQFRLLFEATGVSNQYRIKTFSDTVTMPIQYLPRDRIVKFRVHNGNWELPNPKLLQLHACIGNFLHMSGQAEAIDKILKDFEDCGGLTPSGSTNIGDLLAASKLSLLPSNVDKTSASPSTEKQRPAEEQGRLRANSLGTENKPWGH